MDIQLSGKRAIVTGGSRGIGKAIARALADEGVEVVIGARGEEALEASAAEIAPPGSGSTVVAIGVDTSDDNSVRRFVAGAVEALGGLDILVNCAAQPSGQAPAPKWWSSRARPFSPTST